MSMHPGIGIWSGTTALAMGCLLPLITSGCAARNRPTSAPAQLHQIGVYESRAIAVAFVRSRFNTQFTALLDEYNRAKAAGDKERIAKLKPEVHRMQDRLHGQAFGMTPVDDLLAPIQERIPAICATAGVERIAPTWSLDSLFLSKVDVTDQLVAEFEPSEKTLKTIRELRKHPPILWVPSHWD